MQFSYLNFLIEVHQSPTKTLIGLLIVKKKAEKELTLRENFYLEEIY